VEKVTEVDALREGDKVVFKGEKWQGEIVAGELIGKDEKLRSSVRNGSSGSRRHSWPSPLKVRWCSSTAAMPMRGKAANFFPSNCSKWAR